MTPRTGTHGGKAAAFTCSYVPEEILLAAGFRPVRFLPEAEPGDADAHVHPNTCGYLKSLLAAGMRGEPAGARAIVFANCCDGMRRLFDLWGRFVPGVPAVFMDLPKNADPLAVAFFRTELQRLGERLLRVQRRPGTLPPEAVADAIRSCNRTREQMEELFSRYGMKGAPGSAAELYALGHGPADAAAGRPRRVKRLLAETGPAAPEDGAGGVVVSGSYLRTPDLLSMIENAGVRIAALDTCLTTRRFRTCVEEEPADPYRALAERYLARPPCPRMNRFEDRWDSLLVLVRESGARGLVYAPLKFCDPFQYDTWLLIERSRAEGIPLLILEGEYEAGISAQVRTRVEAFLENL